MVSSFILQVEGDITILLRQWRDGDKRALDHLMPLVYPRLRAIAGSLDRHQTKTPTLHATALVHEAYLRLLNQRNLNWEDREHFYSFSAHVMRFILTDHARARLSDKRGGAETRVPLLDVPLHNDMQWIPLGGEEILELNQALDELAELDPRKVRIIELRYYLGCTADETADVLGISKATVDRELQVARAWLFRRLKPPLPEPKIRP